MSISNSSDASAPRLQRLLLTGAAGGLGKVLRERLVPYADVLRVSDIAALGEAKGPHEEVAPCDLSDKQAVDALLAGCDAIVHLGGVSVERPFEEILEANIKGIFNVYEAARRHGVKRVVFASSNHVIGFYKQTDPLDASVLRRPDGYYGLSKSFGEDMAQFYFDRYGIETVSIRIGSSFPEPLNRRMMSTWLSYDDLVQLVEKSLFTPNVKHTIVYGASANQSVWWNNHAAAHLGWTPKDNSEVFRAKVEAQPPVAANDPNAIYQGGAFTAQGPFGTELSTVELILDARNGTGESPVWHVGEQALYWVDIPGKTINRWSPTAGHRQWTTEEMPACIAATATPGQWIAGMETGVFSLQLQDDGKAAATRLAEVAHATPAMRFNDGRCDRQGRLWAGTMCLDMAAGIRAGVWYRFAQGETALPAQISDFIVPNGLAFSPDGKTMYVSDSHPTVQQVWAYDYDTQSGTPSNRRLFIDMNAFPGRPDGAAMDVDGCYWICGNDAGLIHRFTPDGRLDKSLAVPVKKPAMCAFGGPQLDTLYVTSIRPGGDLSDQPLAGGVFALHPGVCGLPEPSFAV